MLGGGEGGGRRDYLLVTNEMVMSFASVIHSRSCLGHSVVYS